ncbi:Metabotropic GABA-B receptor subtype 2, isoform C [Chamberlinius hualienensis]
MLLLCRRTFDLLTVAIFFFLRVEGSDNNNVYVAGFFPVGEGVTEGRVGMGVIPAVKLARRHINENSGILDGYRLEILWNNTECDAAVGMKAFFDMVAQPPPKVLIFGAACTQVTDPIAKTSLYWHLNQLSYADTHPMFTMDSYPNLFRMVPSETGFNPPRVYLLKHYNWTWVGTLYQMDPRYALAHNKLLTLLEQENIKIAEAQSIADEVEPAMSKLKEKDVRIILGNFNESWARHVFCEVYRLGMYGRKYQWIIMGMYSENWWTKVEGNLKCTIEQLTTAIDGVLITDLLPLRYNDVKTISGLTASAYLDDYNRNRGSEYSRFHGYAYDGMWTMALAIRNVLRRLPNINLRQFMEEMDQPQPSKLRSRNSRTKDGTARNRRSNGSDLELFNFRYRDRVWGRIFLEALNETDFEGVTGPVRFVENDRRGYILVKQFQGEQEVMVGVYDGTTGELDFSLGQPIRWKGSGPPAAKTHYVIETTRVSLTIYLTLASLALLGIMVAIIFLTINIRHRHQRFIKMSSPHLNNLIIIGCILTYTSVILLGLDSDLTSPDSLPYVCTVRAWVLMAGFTLAFGSMFSKTWRVHTIFTNIKLNKKAITDFQLFAIVGVLLILDIAIMTTWQVVDPFYRETKQLPPMPSSVAEDILVIPQVEYCRSGRMSLFLGAIYLTKGLLMVIGCFLAWETRHVTIPALNDSKYVGMSVYNVVIMCVMGAAISSILSDQQNAAFIIISIFIIFCTTLTLCLVFVPKVVELQRNPKGNDTRIRAALQPSTHKKRQDSCNGEKSAAEILRQLQELNVQYKRTLKEKDLVLRNLIKQLGGENVADILTTNTHSKLRYPRIVEILKVEAGTSSGSDEDDQTSLVSMYSSQDGEGMLLVEKDTLRSQDRRSITSDMPSSSITVVSIEAMTIEADSDELTQPVESAGACVIVSSIEACAILSADAACQDSITPSCVEPEVESNCAASVATASNSIALIEFSPINRKRAPRKPRPLMVTREGMIQVTLDDEDTSPPVYV